MTTDLSVFKHIESETSDGDKRSLLALRDLAAANGPFSYLEIGSHLGGSLQPFVIDERCTSIVSIDPRPLAVPDKRLPSSETFSYEGNSSERMLALLDSIPGADITKIRSIEASTEAIDPASITETPTLCFIDGEHTDRAALRDALFCAAVAPDAVVAFHDRGIVGRGIGAFMRVSAGYGCPLPDTIFAIDPTGPERLTDLQRHPRVWRVANATSVAGEAAAFSAFWRLTARRARSALGLPEFHR